MPEWCQWLGPWTWFGGGFAILFIVGLIVLLVWEIAKLVQGGSAVQE